MIAGENEMVPVVDRLLKGWVVIGAASPAGLIGCLMHADAHTLRRQIHGGGEAGQSSANDVDQTRHHTMAYCSRIRRSCLRFSLMRSRGACHPRAIIRASSKR